METKKYRFDEVTINFDKKRIPLSSAQREKRQGTFRYYGAQGVIDHVDDYIYDGTYLLIAEDGENLKSKKQNIAQVVDGQFWVNNHAHIVQGNEQCDTRFLCYLINSMDLSGYVTGSAQPKLSQAYLNAITLSLPTLVEQKRIVEYLYMLDQKIDVNRQINDNLEAQALALFSDFVSQHNEKWEQGKLGDVISSANTGGDAIQKVPIVDYDTGIKCARVGDITNAREFASWAFCSATNSVFDNYKLQAGDILVTRTATLGITQYIPSDISAVYNNGLIRLKTDNNRALPLYVYLAINTSDFMNYINQMNSATSVRPNMKIDYLLNYQLLIPPIEKQIQFVKAVEVLMNAISLNNNERLKLCDFQSTLLNTLSRR